MPNSFVFSTNIYNENYQSNYHNAPSFNMINSNTQNYLNSYPNQNYFMNQINNMKNLINNMNNMISNMKSENKEDKKRMEMKFKTLEMQNNRMKMKFKTLEKQNKEQMIKNEKLEKEIIILKEKSIETNNEIVQGLDKIELNLKDLKVNINLNKKHDEELLKQIKQIINILIKIDEQAEYMKKYVDKKMKENQEENEKMKKTIEKLTEIVKELQEIIISRKILKIIIKKIILNCFKTFDIIAENKKNYITNVKLKEEKYGKMINISNNILDAIFQSNRIMHIDGAIHRLMDAINNKTTYGDLLDIYEKTIKKKDFEPIKKLFEDKLLILKTYYSELIDEVETLFKILSELSINNKQ